MSSGPASLTPGILVFAYHDVGFECLDVLIRRRERVLGVITHADNPNEHIWFKSVADLARRHAIPVHTPVSVNTAEWVGRIRGLAPGIIFSFYYRDMIGQPILDVPSLGAFNMHGSLLPRYRGRVPINWAVLHGEKETGATLHYMVKRADAGDIVDQQAVPIGPQETAKDVFVNVTVAAREVLERSIDSIKSGHPPRVAQDETRATYFGGRKAEDGRIDWRQPAVAIFNLIRAVTHPYPGAFTELNGRTLYIWWAQPGPDAGGEPGEIVGLDPLRVATGNGTLSPVRLQWRGAEQEETTASTHGLRIGDRFTVGQQSAVAR